MVCLLRCSSYFCLLLQQITALPITNKYDVTLPSLSDSVMSFCRHFRVSFILFRATLAPIPTPQKINSATLAQTRLHPSPNLSPIAEKQTTA